MGKGACGGEEHADQPSRAQPSRAQQRGGDAPGSTDPATAAWAQWLRPTAARAKEARSEGPDRGPLIQVSILHRNLLAAGAPATLDFSPGGARAEHVPDSEADQEDSRDVNQMSERHPR